ncbi:hypothetical protein RHMOL_Rhmol08G0088700 [Rhododendron molle]|uniref:Uncharacterized protein n=1 Tax=Rhododendron molle TaxID=49168 RepID=A0ACC0MN79_RHOML|nr:hypothetical protein RHMOL_Rhmol08G0088700 [Rhododendron molle]
MFNQTLSFNSLSREINMRGTGIFSVVLCLVIFPRFPSGNSEPRLAPALYVLGDSLFDSGNNNFLPTLARADFQPYGVNFPGGATGRFTNGRTVADFIVVTLFFLSFLVSLLVGAFFGGLKIAEFLGLPMSPPFMSFQNSRTLTGLNYASGSCGILPETGNYIGKCLNLDDQIGLFGKTVKNELTKHLGSSEVLSDYLSKSIFLVSTGNNDYINNYLQPNLYDSSSRYSPRSFAQLLTDSLSHKLSLTPLSLSL